MTTKEYLSQAYRIDQRINSKLEQVMSLRDLLEKANATLSDAPRSPSPSPHSMEDNIIKIIELENSINSDIDLLLDLKKEIMACIKKVSNPEYQTILELRYLCFKRWEQVAMDMGYSMRRLFELHDAALQAVIIKSPQ